MYIDSSSNVCESLECKEQKNGLNKYTSSFHQILSTCYLFLKSIFEFNSTGPSHFLYYIHITLKYLLPFSYKLILE